MKHIILAALAALPMTGLASESCKFPDSERGEAPAWLCDGYTREGATFLAIAERSRIPSISLQNRLAGRDAMAKVCELLLADAVTSLQAELPAGTVLALPDANDIDRLARFDGIQIFEKVKSPRRYLYVLGGVAVDDLTHLKSVARDEVIAENRVHLQSIIGDAALQALTALHTSKAGE